MNESKLVDGKIPKFKDCPFRKECKIASSHNCHHTGVGHPFEYSCGSARGFDIIERTRNKEIEVTRK